MQARILLLSLAVVLSGCRSSDGELGEMVNAGDPNMAVQLVGGFHSIENGWRWTEGTFAVGVKVPKRAGTSGATLVLKFSIPEAIQANRPTTTIRPMVAGNDLPEESVTKPGLQQLRRDVPAEWLRDKTTVRLEFRISPPTPPSDADKRELGIIVHEVGLVRK
jgi:hypothetical protein